MATETSDGTTHGATRDAVGGLWHVGRELGRGGMGRVLEAEATPAALRLFADLVPAGASLVIKFLESPTLRARFDAEDALLSRLAHPGLPALVARGLDTRRDEPFSVRTFVPGTPLEPGRADARGDAAFIGIALDLIDVLEHMHRRGYVHGDVAPINALWDADEQPRARARLIDLGAAAAFDVSDMPTSPGTTSGILAYCAPERLRGEAPSPLSDLWALGAILWGLRYGEHPLPGYPVRGIDAGPVAPRHADAFTAVLMRMLAPSPKERQPELVVVREALLAAAAGSSDSANGAPSAATRTHFPHVDHDGALEAGVEAVRAAAREGLAVAVDAPPGGKTRWLEAMLHQIAVDHRGPIAIADVATDDPTAVFRALATAACGAESCPAADAPLAALFEPLLRSGAILVFDDLAEHEAVRSAVTTLVRSLDSSPRAYAPTVILTGGRGANPGSARPWSREAIAALLAATYPGRRVMAHTLDALVEATGGDIGNVTAVLRSLALSGQLRLDREWVGLPDAAVIREALPDIRRDVVDTLDSPAQRLFGVVAWAEGPIATEGLGDETALRALRRAGVIVGDARVAPASSRWREVGRSLVPADIAHEALAHALSASGELDRALAHRVRLGAQDALGEALRAIAENHAGAETLALAIADRAKGAETTWTTRLAAAEALLDAGRPDVATEILGAADVPAEATREEERRHATLRGRLLFGATAYGDARAAFERALAVDSRAADAAALHAEIARCAVLTGDLDGGEAHATTAEGLGRGETAPLMAARLGYVRGLIGWFRGTLDDAARVLDEADARLVGALEEALKPSARRRLQSERAAVRLARGLVAHRRGGDGALEEAQAHYQAALSDAEAVHDMARVLGAIQNLGVIAHERGQFLAALDTYRRALTLAEGLGQTARIAQVGGNLGNLHRYLGAPDDARRVLLRAREAATSANNRHATLLADNLLGDVAMDLGETRAASAHYDAAWDAAEAGAMASELAEIGLNRARAAIAAGAPAIARAHLGAAANQAVALKQTAILGQLAVTECDIARATLSPAPDTARASMLEGFRAASNVEAKWDIARGLAVDARERGDWADAERWAREVLELLAGQRDTVPSDRQGAFFERPDRARALREATSIVKARAAAGSTPVGAGPTMDWNRIIEVAKRVASERDVERLLAYIMDSAVLLSRAERGFLVLAEKPGDGENVDVRIARNLDQENIRQRRDKISRSIVRRVIETAEPALTVDAMEDERYRGNESVHDMRLRSILCVPMRFRGVSLGAIYVDNRFQTAVFSEQDMRALEALADLSAIALDTARTMSHLAAQRDQLEAARREVANLNERLATELARREEELDASREALRAERRTLGSPSDYAGIIGTAPPMQRLFGLIDRLRAADLPVLIEGESGTGKELVARAIHFGGPREERPFVAVNCGAIPQGLIESELFGHVKGAFTSAHQDKRGLFEVADTGTLFLDEIGELPLEMQVKLLRVLQSGEIQKVGATRQTRVQVRILAATNRRLEDEIAAQRFREDLFYRLSVVRLPLPPLRARRDDIPILVRHFIDKHRTPGGPTRVDRSALSVLERAPWPGNVRQLETVIRSALVFADGAAITAADLPPLSEGGRTSDVALSDTAIVPLADLERQAILSALEACGGNKSNAARALGIDRRTLYNKLAGWGIK